MLLPKFLSRKKISRKYRSIFGVKNRSCDRRESKELELEHLVVQFFWMLGTRHQSEGIEKYPGEGSEEVDKNGFVERTLTQQHCADRLRKQAWVVNPGKEGNIPRPGWGKKDEKCKKGGRGATDRDRTCSKNWDTEKNINSSSLGISSPLESGQIERRYFHRRAR